VAASNLYPVADHTLLATISDYVRCIVQPLPESASECAPQRQVDPSGACKIDRAAGSGEALDEPHDPVSGPNIGGGMRRFEAAS
jgi:hypothetical protein